jgi:hypothetical protein
VTSFIVIHEVPAAVTVQHLRELVERGQPEGEAAKAIEAERRRFVGEVLAALPPAGDR